MKLLKRIKKKLFPKNDPRLFLLKELPKGSVGAEVGAWKGSFSKRILAHVTPQKLYLIDPYKYIADYENAWYGGMSGGQEKMDEVYQSVADRFANEIKINQLEIIRKESDEGINLLKDNELDWIYIDGNHMYEFVKKDLHNSWEKVKVGGLLTGDDYGLKGWWDDGVTKAVDEFVIDKKESIGKTIFRGTQFILEKTKS